MSLKFDGRPLAGAPRRLIMLAIDGMDHDLLNELAEANLMPHLSALLDAGCWGRATFPLPRHAESGWTSVATGMLPDRHGILHGNERIGDGIFVRAASAASLRAPGLWHLAAAAGMQPALIGWPATGGLEVDGCLIIAPGIALASGGIDQAWPLHPGAVWPQALRAAVREYRVHPEEIRAADIEAMLGPLAGLSRQQIEPEFAAALAELVTLHALGTWALDELDRDVLMLRLPFLVIVTGLLSRVAADPGVRSCLVRCYQFLDLLIGRYQNLAGSEATYALVSNGNSGIAEGAAAVRRDDQGFLVLAGPGIRRDAVIGPLAATDILPTLAALFGWQLDAQPDGEPLVESMHPDAAPLATARRHVAPMTAAQIGPTVPVVFDNAELLQGAGIPFPDHAAQTRFAQQIECDMLLALAQVQLQRTEHQAVLALLKELLQRFPGDLAARALLAETLFWCGRIDECESMAREFEQVQAGGIWADFAYGMIAFARRDWVEAAMRFKRLSASAASPVNAHAWLGWLHAQQADWLGSHRHFTAATERDPREARAWEGLGMACSMLNRHADAVHALGRAASLVPHSAQLLLRLGEAWEKCGEPEHAARLRARAMRLDPDAAAAGALRQQGTWST